MAGDPVNERFFPYGFIAVAAVRCERMALEVMIYRSVKTEAGDGDKPPELAGRPGFSAEREVPIAAVCRPLSAHDENRDVAEAIGCRARSGGLGDRLACTFQGDNAQEQGRNHNQDAQAEHDEVAMGLVSDGAPKESGEG